MPRSLRAMMNAGHISAKAAARHFPLANQKSRAQDSKMAPMHQDTDDEGTADAGELHANHINSREHQKMGPKPSRGAQARGGTTPGANHINQKKLVAKKFPRESEMASKPQRNKTPAAAKGTVAQSAHMYQGSTAKPRAY